MLIPKKISKWCHCLYVCLLRLLCISLFQILTLNMRVWVILIQHSQYHGCWCHGCLHCQDIHSHYIDYRIFRSSSYSRKDFNYFCHVIISWWHTHRWSEIEVVSHEIAIINFGLCYQQLTYQCNILSIISYFQLSMDWSSGSSGPVAKPAWWD